MFDIGATELLLIVIVAILVIGPKELPTALRTAGRWIGKMRKISGQFRSGIDTMVREAEMEDMEAKWKAQNEKIMAQHPNGNPDEMQPTGAYPTKKSASAEAGAEAGADSGGGASLNATPDHKPVPDGEPAPHLTGPVEGPEPASAENIPAASAEGGAETQPSLRETAEPSLFPDRKPVKNGATPPKPEGS